MSALGMLITVSLLQTVQTQKEALFVSVGLASLVMDEPLGLDAQVWSTLDNLCQLNYAMISHIL